uniref:Peroxisomal multifunctional enzyme type 2 n=1 Tax=Aceria tosichella TaxID=561515 RepID=A0A6G1SJ58_9ACAR
MDQSEFVYTPETNILYALGIGEDEDLKYLYECSEGFTFFPTFCILPSIKALIDFDTHQTHLARLKIPFDVSRLLHGEQFIEFYAPLPQNENKFITKPPHMVELLDKGSNTVVITENNTYSQNGKLLCRNQTCCMIIGSGGWNGPRTTTNKLVENIVDIPKRQPDKVAEQVTHVNQAALYRLSGDRNPLHIDPRFAQAGGYSKPILHGLCSLGFAARHVIKSYPDERVVRLKARFSGVIYPGETIVTSMWREGDRVHFQCSVKETNKIIITGAYIDLNK